MPAYLLQKVACPPSVKPARAHPRPVLSQALAPYRMEVQMGGRLQRLQLEAGQISLYPEGEYPRTEMLDTTEKLMLELDPQRLATTIADVTGRPWPGMPRLSGLDDPRLQQIMQALWLAQQHTYPAHELYLESLYLQLCIHLSRTYLALPEDTGGARLSAQEVQHLRAYIQAHLGDALNLQDLAQLVHLSPSHFAHVFKQSTGATPHQYVLQQKVQHAQQLLRQRQYSLQEVAFQAGFYDQSHFTRVFRQLTGITPRAFRQSLHSPKSA